MRSNTAVSAYFDALFPGSVQKVTLMLELPELEALIRKRDRVAHRLEWALVVQGDLSKLRCAWTRKPASIDVLVEELREVRRGGPRWDRRGRSATWYWRLEWAKSC